MEKTAALVGQHHDRLSLTIFPGGCPQRKVDLAVPLPAKEGDPLGSSMAEGWPQNAIASLKQKLASKGAN